MAPPARRRPARHRPPPLRPAGGLGARPRRRPGLRLGGAARHDAAARRPHRLAAARARTSSPTCSTAPLPSSPTAAPGLIMESRSHGHLPVVVARDPGLGEHVDDHQQRFVGRLGARGSCTVVHTGDGLGRAVQAARSPGRDRASRTHDRDPGVDLSREVGELVGSLVTARPPRPRGGLVASLVQEPGPLLALPSSARSRRLREQRRRAAVVAAGDVLAALTAILLVVWTGTVDEPVTAANVVGMPVAWALCVSARRGYEDRLMSGWTGGGRGRRRGRPPAHRRGRASPRRSATSPSRRPGSWSWSPRRSACPSCRAPACAPLDGWRGAAGRPRQRDRRGRTPRRRRRARGRAAPTPRPRADGGRERPGGSRGGARRQHRGRRGRAVPRARPARACAGWAGSWSAPAPSSS